MLETIDEKNRPYDSYFYSGAPSYYKLKFKVYEYLLSAPHGGQESTITSSLVLKEKPQLEEVLDERIEDKAVEFYVNCLLMILLVFVYSILIWQVW